MIIYDKRKPKTFDGANCVGITGENLAETTCVEGQKKRHFHARLF